VAVVTLVPSTASSLDEVLRIERDPENSPFIRQWSLEQHSDSLRASDAAHLTAIDSRGSVVGYVILPGLDNPDRSLEFKRIAIADKERGLGKEVVQQVKRIAFDDYGAHRLWLEVMEHNERARRLYRSAGFVEEGTHRESLKQGERFISLVVMSMLKQEYQHQRSST